MACGRWFTVVVTRPYEGPPLEEWRRRQRLLGRARVRKALRVVVARMQGARLWAAWRQWLAQHKEGVALEAVAGGGAAALGLTQKEEVRVRALRWQRGVAEAVSR